MRADSIETYQHFCDAQQDMPLFMQPWYLDAVVEKGTWDVCLLEHKGKIRAAMPFHTRRKAGFSLQLMPVFCKYGGPYIEPDWREEKGIKLCKQLLDKLPDTDASIFNLHPSMPHGLPFYWAGFSLENMYTYRLANIQNLEETYNNISRDYRNNKIRSASDVVEVVPTEDIELFYHTSAKTFKRQGMDVPYSLEYVIRYDKVLASRKARKIFIARDEQQRIHSALYLIWDHTCAYLLMAGDDPKLRSSGAGILLTWHAIKYSAEELGVNQFDFLGSMIRGVARVRRQFGANPVPYLKVSRFQGLKGKILKHGLHLLKKT